MIYTYFLILLVAGETKILNPINIPKQQFYLKNVGINYGVAGEDINFSRASESWIHGEDISIAIFGTGCSNTLKITENESINPNIDIKPTLGDYMKDLITGSPESFCTPGIAYRSTLKCLPFLENATDDMELTDPFMQNNRNNLMKINSFPFTSPCKNKEIEVDQYDDNVENSWSSKLVRGRNGLGWVALFSPAECGGLSTDPNYRILMQSRFAINIAATTNRGDRAFYSPKSANLLFNVPSTDSSIDYNSNITINPMYSNIENNVCKPSPINKMVAANAIATGALAVIMQANKFLSWRSLQLIMALSSTVNDANHTSWVKNAANVMYSNIYGFGRLNVGKALEIAPKIGNLPPELQIGTTNTYDDLSIPSCRCAPLKLVHKFNNAKKVNFIESVQFIISTSHDSIGDLSIEIISPSGTKAVINDVSMTEKIGGGFKKFAFTARQFLGESSSGEWTVIVSAAGCIPTGRIRTTTLKIFGVDRFSFSEKKTLAASSSTSEELIGNIFPQPVSYTKYTQLPPSKSVILELENYHEQETLIAGNNVTIHIKNLGQLSDKPAILFYTSGDPDRAGAPSCGVTKFEHASEIDGFKLLPPHNLAGKENVTFIVNIIESTDNIVSARCGPFSLSKMTNDTQQYEIIQKGKAIQRNYSVDSVVDDVLTTVIDYDNKTVVHQSIEKNTGYVSFSIPEEMKIYRGILTVQPLTMNPDPCSIYVHAFYVDDGSNNIIRDSSFKFNESSACTKINGLDYQVANDPVAIPIDRTVSATPFIPTQTPQVNAAEPTDPEDDSKEKTVITKTAIITIASIFSVCVVLIIVGVIVLITRVKYTSKTAPNDYASENEITPVATL